MNAILTIVTKMPPATTPRELSFAIAHLVIREMDCCAQVCVQ